MGGDGGIHDNIRGNKRTVIELEDVWVKYAGSGRPAIREINLTLRTSSIVVVTGPNGSGKTTLIETCLGLLKPYKGIAKLLGINTRSRRIIRARKLCSYVPQNFMKPPHETYSVSEVIAMGLSSKKGVLKGITKDDWEEINSVAELLELQDLLDKPIGKLSGGQQQRVLIARALVRKPLIMFLDEPFSSIDREFRYKITDLLVKYTRSKGALTVIVSHDIVPLRDFYDVMIEVRNGKISKVIEKHDY